MTIKSAGALVVMLGILGALILGLSRSSRSIQPGVWLDLQGKLVRTNQDYQLQAVRGYPTIFLVNPQTPGLSAALNPLVGQRVTLHGTFTQTDVTSFLATRINSINLFSDAERTQLEEPVLTKDTFDRLDPTHRQCVRDAIGPANTLSVANNLPLLLYAEQQQKLLRCLDKE